MKKILSTLTILFIFIPFTYAQVEIIPSVESEIVELKPTDSNVIYTDVDEEGEFLFGADSFKQFVSSKFVMPTVAKELKINGLIMLQFVVEKDSTISNIRSVMPKQRELGYGLEEECIRVINLSSGQWKPSLRAGKAVRSYWRFPFEIDNTPKKVATYPKDKIIEQKQFLTADPGIQDLKIYSIADTSADAKSTKNKLTEFVNLNYKLPEVAKELGIKGTVFIQFVVERDGSVANIRAIYPTERQLGYGLEQECMRVLRLTNGKWNPAMRAGKAIRSYYTFYYSIDANLELAAPKKKTKKGKKN